MKYLFFCLLIFVTCSNQVVRGNWKQEGNQASINNKRAERGDAAGKLYLRTFMVSSSMGSSLTIDWIYLGNDGTIVYNPSNGVDPVNYTAERINNADNLGKYKIQGNQLVITWENGKTANFSLEFKDGDINILDGGIMVKQPGVPAGFTLNGQYAAGTMKKTMGNTQTYIFSNDGSFILKRLGSVRTQEGTGKSEDQLPGHYSITGNTLSLQFDDGTKEKAVIGIRNMTGGIKYLIINKFSFRMEK
jgi:hypothetical protein